MDETRHRSEARSGRVAGGLQRDRPASSIDRALLRSGPEAQV